MRFTLESLAGLPAGQALGKPCNEVVCGKDISPGWRAKARASRRALPSLTPREVEILLLLAAGQSTAGMVKALGVSPATVRTHVEDMLRKLRVHSRLEADGYLGIIDPSVPNTETAPCWLVVTKGGRYVVTTNTPDDSLSAYAIDFEGFLSLLDEDGRTASRDQAPAHSIWI